MGCEVGVSPDLTIESADLTGLQAVNWAGGRDWLGMVRPGKCLGAIRAMARHAAY